MFCDLCRVLASTSRFLLPVYFQKEIYASRQFIYLSFFFFRRLLLTELVVNQALEGNF